MQSTLLDGTPDFGDATAWWTAAVVGAFTAPLGLVAWPPPAGAPTAAARRARDTSIVFRGAGEPRRFNDRNIRHDAGEQARRRLAQQLHDDLGGVLTGLKACLTVSLERAVHAGLTPDPLLADAAALAEAAFDAVRCLASDAPPAILDQLGLWGALDWHVSKLARRTNMRCELRVDEAVAASRLGSERELAIYRIVQQALTNVERHACAWELVVSATRSADALSVTVRDDGVGIGADRQDMNCALGIRGMRERARALEGELALHSESDAGTQVRLTLPLPAENGDGE